MSAGVYCLKISAHSIKDNVNTLPKTTNINAIPTLQIFWEDCTAPLHLLNQQVVITQSYMHVHCMYLIILNAADPLEDILFIELLLHPKREQARRL